MPECINYAKRVLKESQAFQARPPLYHSVHYRRSVSRHNLATNPIRSRISNCNSIPYFHRVSGAQEHKGQNIPIRHSKAATQVQHHKRKDGYGTEGAQDL